MSKKDHLNSYDKALHDAIHESMMMADPKELLDNKRLSVVELAINKIGEPYGVIADLGCGSGYLSVFLAKNFLNIDQVDAVEASEIAINNVIPNNVIYYGVERKVNAKLASFDELEPSRYDFIFVMGALHHSKDIRATIKSISNSLKKGGYLIAQEPAMPDDTTHDDYDYKYNIIEERFGLKIRNGDRFDRFFRECEYKAALVSNGFDLVMWDNVDELFRERFFSIKKITFILKRIKKYGVVSSIKKIINKMSVNKRVKLDGDCWVG